MARIVGIDLARCLALLGMITAHLVDEGAAAEQVSGWFQLTSGRSAALFAVLAGVSIALVTRDRGDRNMHRLRRALVARALVIAVLGLALGVPDSGLAVILTYYGVLFLVAVPVITWSARSLALLALGWGLLSPVISLLLRRHLPVSTYAVPDPGTLTDPLQLLSELTVTGYYPVLTWATYLWAGMAIGRLPLRTTQVRRWLILLGAWLGVAALAVDRVVLSRASVRAELVASYDRWEPVQTWADLDRVLQTGLYGTTPTGSFAWLWVWSPHSGSVVDLAHTVGCSMFLIGMALLVVALVGRSGSPVVRVLAGPGTMTLTLYAAHIVVVSLGRGGAATAGVPWSLELGWHLVGALLIGAVFALARWRGPLEWLVSQVSTRAAGLRP